MISFIVAMDRNRVIGKGNQLPWHLPEDLAFFKRTTKEHSIVMGRKTHESIGRPLPYRKNIILTRDPSYESDGCEIINNVQSIRDMASKEGEEVFVIGGSEVFDQLFSEADRLYITKIDHSFEGDTYFPDFSHDEWKLISSEKGIKNEKNPYDYSFNLYERCT